MQDLLVRNTLDVMHHEKNSCENILKIIFWHKGYHGYSKRLERMHDKSTSLASNYCRWVD
jgi:hypothetical protein